VYANFAESPKSEVQYSPVQSFLCMTVPGHRREHKKGSRVEEGSSLFLPALVLLCVVQFALQPLHLSFGIFDRFAANGRIPDVSVYHIEGGDCEAHLLL
jgi:hypothetical protein